MSVHFDDCECTGVLHTPLFASKMILIFCGMILAMIIIGHVQHVHTFLFKGGDRWDFFKRTWEYLL